MATRSFLQHPQSASFHIDVDTDLDLDATTPIRSFDVRAAVDLDATFANPDHPLITAERELNLPPPLPTPYRRASVPSAPHPESHGSLAPTAMEVPQSYFASFPTPANGIKAPPLCIVSTAGSMSRTSHAELFVLPEPASRSGMSFPKIAVMCGALAVAAALVAFTAALSADTSSDVAVNAGAVNGGAANAGAVNAALHNAAAPQQESTAIPRRTEPRSAALTPETAKLFAPADPSSDWRARLLANQSPGSGVTNRAKAQH